MSDLWIRLAFFVTMLVAMSVLERAFAAVPTPPQRNRMRWINLALGALGAASVRLLVPMVSVFVAAEVATGQAGLLQALSLPMALQLAIGILMLDLAIYWQHRWMHAVPVLWRLHRTHHLDEHLDATSAVRFHPVEILVSALWRAIVIAVLGVPLLAVLIFEVTVNAAALFHHANLRLPANWDRALRRAVVTPALHRIHHSVLMADEHSNFGFSVTVWDRLFGSYRDRSDQASEVPRVGVEGTHPAPQTLPQVLLDPFR